MATYRNSDEALMERVRRYIKRFEQLRLTGFQDSKGVWTIGYGHTGGVAV